MTPSLRLFPTLNETKGAHGIKHRRRRRRSTEGGRKEITLNLGLRLFNDAVSTADVIESDNVAVCYDQI
jgi:hypothetical protein